MKTLNEKLDKDGVGAIIGRFQVDELEAGHKSLINSVVDRHDRVIIVLGLSAVRSTKDNPLDFASRAAMIKEQYEDITIVYVNDQSSNEQWSSTVDNIISSQLPPGNKITLYGSRDSFAKCYSGRFGVKELLQEDYISGTEIRKKTALRPIMSRDFRKGAIWACHNRYDTSFQAVDMAVIDDRVTEGGTRILLGQKPNEDKWRFFGGFTEPSISDNDGDFLEMNAIRETKEESNLDVKDPEYVGSFRVDDWRYAGERDKIATALFVAKYNGGVPEPKDDIAKVKWFNLHHFRAESFLKDNLVNTHKPLMLKLLKKVK